MIWIAYSRSGKEFDVQAEIAELGITSWVARKIEAKRVPTKRLPVAVIAPYLANYIFITATDDDWHRLQGIKHLAHTMTPVSPKAARAYLDPFKARIDTDFDARQAAINAGERVSEYAPGDLLRIMAGPLAGQIATFRKLVETDHDIFPRIRAEVALFGRITEIDLDPINARPA